MGMGRQIMAQNTGNNHLKDDGLRSTVALALLKARKAFFGVGVFSFFINLLMLTGPIYMLQVYDRVLISGSISTLVAISVLMAALYTFMGILEFIRSRVLVRVAREFEKDLGERTFGIWLKQGLVGQAAQRHAPLNDLGTIRQFLSGNGPRTFFDVPWVPVYIAAIFFLHWTLGLIAVAGAIIIFCIALRNEIGSRTPLIESLKLRRIEQTMSQQSHRNADVIEAMGMSGPVINRWKQLNDKYAV